MISKENFEKWLSENSLIILGVILLAAVISAVLVIGVYVVYFRGMAPAATWGQVGDFFGGTLNPIFGFFSVMALLAALVVQSRELKVSTQELRNSALALDAQNKAIAHQSFEQTFFSWLQNYRDMLGSIEHVLRGSSGTVEFKGRKALQRWWSESIEVGCVISEIGKNDHRYDRTFNFNDSEIEIFLLAAKVDPDLLTTTALELWEGVYRRNEYQLDSFFRNLYRLMLWIDSQHETRMSLEQKWLYISIVRAQLSWIEMVYLFYNGYTERGKNFKRLVDKYALFDNLNFDSDYVIAHIKKHPPKDNHYLETAYDSRLARKELGLPESELIERG